MKRPINPMKVSPFTLSSRWPWAVFRLRTNRRAPLWTMVGGLVVSTILFWVMVQLGQASSDPKPKSLPPQTMAKPEGQLSATGGAHQESEAKDGATASVRSTAQGPAIEVPHEVLEMLDQRKRDLDRREEVLRQNEERLMIVRGQVEELLEQNEALEKRIQTARAKEERPAAQSTKVQADKDRGAQDQRTQLAKIFESMPSEDAAARLERMPDRKAIEILRMVKSKTAGAILSQVKADRAAKLTEQLLVQTP
jgi:flagellar motility protein MotE (MotC chaperone)